MFQPLPRRIWDAGIGCSSLWISPSLCPSPHPNPTPTFREKKNNDGKILTSGIWKENFPPKVLPLGWISALRALCWNPDFPPVFPLFPLPPGVSFPCREQPGLAQGERGREQQSLGCPGWRAGAGIFQEGCVGRKSVGSWHSAAWRGMQGIPGCREFLVPAKPTKTPFSQWDPISQQSRPHIFRFWD